MLKKMLIDFNFTTLGSDLLKKLGVDVYDLAIVGVTLIIILLISIMTVSYTHLDVYKRQHHRS